MCGGGSFDDGVENGRPSGDLLTPGANIFQRGGGRGARGFSLLSFYETILRVLFFLLLSFPLFPTKLGDLPTKRETGEEHIIPDGEDKLGPIRSEGEGRENGGRKPSPLPSLVILGVIQGGGGGQCPFCRGGQVCSDIWQEMTRRRLGTGDGNFKEDNRC